MNTNKYLISKIVAILFGIMTVILFVLSREGMLFQLIGVQMGVILYLVNFVGLMVALVVFIWQRAFNAKPRYENLDILQHVPTTQDADNVHPEPQETLIDDEIFQILSQPGQQQITVATKPEYARFQKGREIQVGSLTKKDAFVIALIVEINHLQMVLRRPSNIGQSLDN